MYKISIFCTFLFLMGCAPTKIKQTELPEVKISTHKNRSIDLFRASKTMYFDLLKTKLEVKPIWSKAQLEGKATLTMSPYFYSTDSVNIDARGFDIYEVSLIKENAIVPLKYRYDSSVIHVKLDRIYNNQEVINVFISYKAKPNEVVKGGSSAIREDKGLYFINPDGKDTTKPTHLWTQGETQANSKWFPTFDMPNEKHSQELIITCEDKYTTLSNGLLANSTKNPDGTRTDVWVQDLPHSVYLTMMAIGEYKVVKDSYNGKEVSYYMEPKYESMARPIFGRTPAMMDFFSKKLGIEFPWDKYSQIIVHDFVAGAMENTGAVTFNNFVQKDSRELLDNNDDATVAHELFHHWFGDLVTCESWSHLPLNESFANYSEYLWSEHYKGRDEADYGNTMNAEGYYNQSRQKTQPLIRFDYKSQEDMFDVLSYSKGGRILHHLRKTIGDDAFFKSLKLYLTRFAFKTAEISNLRQCMEEVTGRDLNWFFNQWFFVGGHPILTFDYQRTDSGIYVYTFQKHNIDDYFVYKLPLNVDIYVENVKYRRNLNIEHVRDTFFYPMRKKQVLFVNIDPEKSLVCEKKDNKNTDEWIAQFRRAPLFHDKFEALKHFKENKANAGVQLAYKTGLNSKIPYVTIESIKYIKINKRDTGLIEKIEFLSKFHKNGQVRAAAIDKLVKLDSLAFIPVFVKLLSDSSYGVESSALNAIDKGNKKFAFNEALKRKDVKNFTLKNTVLNIIALNGDSTYNSYFINASNQHHDFRKAFVFAHYGTFLANKSDAIFNKGFELIKKYRDEHADEWYGKYAYQNAISNALKITSAEKDAQSVSRTEILNKMLNDKSNQKTN